MTETLIRAAEVGSHPDDSLIYPSPDHVSPAPRTADARAAAERSLRRLVIFVVPAWLVALAFSGMSPNCGISPRVLLACLALVLLAYSLFATGRDRRGGLLCGSLFAAVLAIAVAGPHGLNLSGYPMVEPALNLAVLVTGLLFRGRVGAVLVLSMTGTVVAAVGLQQLWLGSPQPAAGLAAIAGYALVDGIGALAASSVLRSAAAASDRAAEDLAATRSRIAAETAGQAEVRRVTRVLHDTVINTLGAIGVFPQQDRGMVRERCAADLDAVDSLHRTDPGDCDPVAAARERAALVGVDLTVREERDPQRLPYPVGEAVAGALSEALVNVSKHARTNRADLDFAWDGRHGTATLTDRGIGYIHRPGMRGGIAESVAARCAEVGVRVRVDTAPGDGTQVRLMWTIPPDAEAAPPGGPEPAGEPIAALMARVTLPIAGVIGAFGVFATLVQPGGTGVLGNLVSLLLVLLVMLWARRTMRGHGPERLPLLLYPVWTVAAVSLPGMGASGCQRVGEWWSGPLAGVAVVVGVIMIDARRSAIAIAILSYAAGNLLVTVDVARTSAECAFDSGSLLVLDVCFLLAALAFRGTLTRQWENGLRTRQLTALAAVSHTETRAREAARASNLSRAMAVCRPLLQGVADGDLDPGAASVRFECGRAAWTLRSLIAMPAEKGVLTPILADLLVTASQRRIDLHVIAEITQPLPADRAGEVREMLEEFLAAIPDRASGHVTALTSGSATQLLASARIPGPGVDRLRRAAVRHRWTIHSDSDGTTLETGWRTEP